MVMYNNTQSKCWTAQSRGLYGESVLVPALLFGSVAWLLQIKATYIGSNRFQAVKMRKDPQACHI